MSSTRFIAHLVNQQIVHELLSLEILTLLLDSPTDDSVEVAITFLRECGQKLNEVSPRGINAIFESLRTVLNESNLEKRTQYMIEVMFQVRKDGFKVRIWGITYEYYIEYFNLKMTKLLFLKPYLISRVLF